MNPLVERLPLEIWFEIITVAVTVPRAEYSFLPPSYDMSLVDGLSKSCFLLERVVGAFIPRKVKLRDADELLNLPNEACGRIECVAHLVSIFSVRH